MSTQPMPPQSEPLVTTNDAAPLSTPIIKRPKTAGEHAFDLFTYGGFALGVNEVLSTWITGAAEDGLKNNKGAVGKFKSFFTEIPGLKRVNYVKSGRLPYILISCIGGMLTVFPVKWMENHKGSIVRRFDRLIHGPKAAQDSALAQAHAEMDDAPKQTWGSLWKGRIITVISAIGLDFFAGQPNAVSTIAFEKTPLRDYGSLERVGVTLSRKSADLLDPKGKAERLLARDATKPYEIQPGEGATVKWFGRGIFLMMFSLTLTALFYYSSKVFATRREVHKEKKLEQEGIVPENAGVYNADSAPAIDVARSRNPSPNTKVTAVAEASRGIVGMQQAQEASR